MAVKTERERERVDCIYAAYIRVGPLLWQLSPVFAFFLVVNYSIALCIIGRDGKEFEPGKNEPNQNPGFAKNPTQPEPKSKNVQEPDLDKTAPRREPKRTGTKMSRFLLSHFTEQNCRYIHTFHSKRGILLHLG